ncbi:hypothetical protein [Leptospira kmetyi]|uniref:hypothetical protein n=1 Tax=Leptospira kmetyi TaxID=408139 RepID=UPI001A9C4233|nr:hypothetical protein [Leptospira kmetyi]
MIQKMNRVHSLVIFISVWFVLVCVPKTDSSDSDNLFVLANTIQRQAFCDTPGAIRIGGNLECFHPVGTKMILNGNSGVPVSNSTITAGTPLKCVSEDGGPGSWYDYDPNKVELKQALSAVTSDFLSYFPIRLINYPAGRSYACVPEASYSFRGFQKIDSIP